MGLCFRLFAGCLAGLLACAAVRAEGLISPQQLASSLATPAAPRVLDVRSDEEFAAGHVPGALSIPHDQLPQRIAELGEPGPVVVYCRSGRRVGLVEPALQAAGFEVIELEGHFPAWQQAELAVTQGTP